MSAVYVAVKNEQSCILTEIICEFQSLQASSEDLLRTMACQFSHKSFIRHRM